jgi:MFS-type transporter involved in bile tolerance (Atg22 family)
MNDPPSTAPPRAGAPAEGLLRHTAFALISSATVVSNIWMYNVASGWLMTSRATQVAKLPMFLFAIPAGALADIVNHRRFLLFGEFVISIVSTASAAWVWLHLIIPSALLAFSFIVEAFCASRANSPGDSS